MFSKYQETYVRQVTPPLGIWRNRNRNEIASGRGESAPARSRAQSCPQLFLHFLSCHYWLLGNRSIFL